MQKVLAPKVLVQIPGEVLEGSGAESIGAEGFGVDEVSEGSGAEPRV